MWARWRFALVIVAAVTVVATVAAARPTVSAVRPAHLDAVFLGDSYTAGAGATARERRFTAIIAKAMGWTEHNLARGGTGYLSHIDDPTVAHIGCGMTYCPSFREMIPQVRAIDPGVVVVSGGRNEIRRADAAWAAGVAAFYRELRAAAPHARIVAMSPIWDEDPKPAALEFMRDVVRQAVTQVGGRYVDLGGPLLGRRDLMAKDAIHPGDLGHAAIAAAFLAA